MSSGQGVIIAKRSASLAKTYLAVGIFMAALSVVISTAAGLVGNLPAGETVPSKGLNLSTSLPLVAVALQVFAALIFATPVLMLYVYDKNNGVLEYFLSLGMSQGDIYRQYLKAALILSSAVVVLDIIVNTVAGLLEHTSGITLLELGALVVVISLPVVSLETLIMMSFSSLQKQRVGSNQPLGFGIGVIMVLPTYVTALVVPSLAFTVDLALAVVFAVLSLVTYLSAGRLISREKLLP